MHEYKVNFIFENRLNNDQLNFILENQVNVILENQLDLNLITR